MHRDNQFPENPERLNGITGSIKNHIGRIEVDLQIRSRHVFNKLQKNLGWFLTRFQRESLSVLTAVVANLARHVADIRVQRRTSVMRHKSDVACDTLDTELCGNIR